MKSSAVLFAIAVTAISFGQAEQKEGLKKPKPRAVKTSEAPVTCDEARTTFMRVETILRKALALPAQTAPVSIPAGKSPVSRAQVVGEFSRIYDVVRPKAKLSPAAVAFDASLIKMSDAKQRANIEKLIRLGAVAKVGPLAVGPSDSLTVPEFGDAIGFFMARMAFITHMPSNKWTPGLQQP